MKYFMKGSYQKNDTYKLFAATTLSVKLNLIFSCALPNLHNGIVVFY